MAKPGDKKGKTARQATTIHGLHKTLGKRMTEGGASTRQLMTFLGHDTIAQAELHSRDTDSIHLAVYAIDKVVAIFADG